MTLWPGASAPATPGWRGRVPLPGRAAGGFADFAFRFGAFIVTALATQVVVARAANLVALDLRPVACLTIAYPAVAVAFSASAPGRRLAFALAAAALALVTILCAYGFAEAPDPGYDSQSYHLPSVIELMQGWNPLRASTGHVFTDSYPNGFWTLMAGIAPWFGLDGARAAKIPLLVATACMFFPVAVRSGLGRRLSLVLTGLVIANPVGLSQILTAYCDDVVYYLSLVLVVATLQLRSASELRTNMVAVVATIVLLGDVKSVAPYFIILVEVSVAVGVFLQARSLRLARRETLAMIAAIAALGLLVGWRPYVTNLVQHGALLYPPLQLLGYSPDDPSQIPSGLRNHGRLFQLGALAFAASSDVGDVHWKLPWVIGRDELGASWGPRIGGFGPLFGLALLSSALYAAVSAAIAGAAAALRSLTSSAFAASFVSSALITTALFPQPWWARFVALAWVVPPFLAVMGWRIIDPDRRRRIARLALAAVLALSALDAALVGYGAFRTEFATIVDQKRKLASLRASPSPIVLSESAAPDPRLGRRRMAEWVWRERLLELGRPDVMIVARDSCRPLVALSVDVQQCENP